MSNESKKYKISAKNLKSFRKKNIDIYDIAIELIRSWLGEGNSYSTSYNLPGGINSNTATPQDMNFLLENNLLVEV